MIKTLLITDIVDSTKLTQEVGDQRMSEIWIAHDKVARSLLKKHHGLEIDRTDGFLMLFDSVKDAVHYAIDIHEGLAALSKSENLPVKARIGIHYGEVIIIEQSEEDQSTGARSLGVEGIAKPLAARVMSVAEGEQTLISHAAYEAMGDPGSIRLISHGHWRMKGVAVPEELFEVGTNETHFKRPLDGEKVYRVHLQDDLWVPVREIKHNLPSERDVFVGRSGYLRQLYNEIEDGAHLITVVGTAGTGKTRFVRRFAWNWLGDYPGGIWFCDLSETKSLEGIVTAMSRTLDVALGNNEPVELLGNAINGRGKCLILLDNFEQVMALAHDTIEKWIDRAPKATFLVTSRNVLNIRGEHLITLPPLPIKTDGVELFTVRAKARNKRFELNESTRRDVESIVNTLDGLPLAIELAAARISILSTSQLKKRLKERFKLLSGSRGKSSRQATLKAAIDWSWELLEPWEKSALAQCSAFDGGFTLTAVESVVELEDHWPDAPWPMDVVQALVDKSLLKLETSGIDLDEPRFGMYASIQEYAKEKLHTPDAFEGAGTEVEQQIWSRHGAYFAEFGNTDFLESLHMHGGSEHALTLAADQENLVTACRRAILQQDGEQAVSLLRAIMEIIRLRGPYNPILLLAKEVMNLRDLEDLQEMHASGILANCFRYSGRLKEAGEFFKKAKALAKSVKDLQSEGIWIGNLGILDYYQGNLKSAVEQFEKATEIAKKVGDEHNEALWQGNLGVLHHNKGHLEKAQEKYEQALRICKAIGDLRNESFWEGNLGVFFHDNGQYQKAQAAYESAMINASKVGDNRTEAYWKGSLGTLLYDQGKLNEAKACLDFALNGAKDNGDILLQGYWLGNLGILLLDQGKPDEAQLKFEEALKIARNCGDRFDESRWLGGLANVFLDKGEKQKAKTQFEEACIVAKDAGDERLEGRILGFLGMLLIEEGNIEMGNAKLKEGEDILRKVSDKKELGILLAIRAQTEYQDNKVEEAMQSLKEAKKLALDVAAGPQTELGKHITTANDLISKSQMKGNPSAVSQ